MRKYSVSVFLFILFLSGGSLLLGNDFTTAYSDDSCCAEVGTNRSAVQNNDPSPLILPLQRLKTGRVQSISAPDAVILPDYSAAGFTNLAELIVGRVAGVQVAGSYQFYRIRIRGALGPPLLVIDGMPFYGDDEHLNSVLQMISPVDVASIEIFKNAAGAVRFGPQSGNGVIVVKTKTGGEEQP